jgi:hypothetical protein
MLGCAVVVLLSIAAPASATFHLMKVREVYPAGSQSYIELQMLDNAENQVGGHHLVMYNPNGTVAQDFTMPHSVSPDSRTNATILIAGPDYETAFPTSPPLDELDPQMNLSPAGGAVCWIEGEPPDCVAWGDFTGPLPPQSPPLMVGNPASPAGVTAGMALRRSIAGGACATKLEAADDTDDSATDFREEAPNPRNNASPIVEQDCHPATVQFTVKPVNPTHSTAAEFLFESIPAGAEFECSLDHVAFASCTHPDDEPLFLPGPFADGSHSFEVRAVNTAGPGPATGYTWIVDTEAPTVTIQSSPANGSSGAAASFTYQASQLGSSYECSLVPAGRPEAFASCSGAGQTYAELADGTYTFEVRATDKAGNQGAPAAYTWQVSNPLAPPVVPTTPSGGSTPPPTTTPKPKPPLRCKKGFVKKKVKGKARCVKKKKKKKHR